MTDSQTPESRDKLLDDLWDDLIVDLADSNQGKAALNRYAATAALAAQKALLDKVIELRPDVQSDYTNQYNDGFNDAVEQYVYRITKERQQLGKEAA